MVFLLMSPSVTPVRLAIVPGRSVEVAGVDVDARDALVAEHLQVTAIVLERQPQGEAVGPQLRDRPTFELPGPRVVAGLAHDEHVPPQLVAPEPGEGLGLDPYRPPGEQHHPQRRVEQLEQPGHLLDQRVLAARVEERVPRPPARLDVVLAAGRVGQDTVDVEDDRRPRLDRSGSPAPVVGLGATAGRRGHSSVGLVDARRRISSTTAASARVVVSPRSRPSATSRSSRRMILPLRVFGSSSVKMMVLGRAMAPILAATCWRRAWPWTSSEVSPAFTVTKAMMAWPVMSSLAPTTAASATVGWSTRADSTSVVETRWPEMFI